MLSQLLLFLAACGFPQAPAVDVLAADRLHLGDGRVLESAVLHFDDQGKLRSIVEGPAPEGALYVEGAVLTPGLIDAYSYLGVGELSLEEASEVTPALPLSATADLDDPGFALALGEGVTSAYLSPDSMNVIGGLGVVVKTCGGQPADLFASSDSAARVLKDKAALKITMGTETGRGNRGPWNNTSLFERRPSTRMATGWLIRREFYKAFQYRRLKLDGKNPPLDADMEVLLQAIDGDIPIRFQARRNHDIQTGLRMQKEFGWKHLIIEEGLEAHKAAPLLVAAKVPVILGPQFDSRSRAQATGFSLADWRLKTNPGPVCCEHLEETLVGEDQERYGHDHFAETGVYEVDGLALDLLFLTLPRYDAYFARGPYLGRMIEAGFGTPATAALLARQGVSVVLGAAEAHDGSVTEGSVIHQARIAHQYGLPAAKALQAVTGDAARLCGVADRTGTLAPGMDGDLVLWSGPPLQADSRPLLVIVDGRIRVDHRSQVQG
ncbi:MAG: hypothetical protein DWQ01_20205 [Planctomycetota bacterium]|nr:MAG: hypothetical protein DWQ01_20205 [Planctomycetota bacterium]